jgi:hypothetical protein
LEDKTESLSSQERSFIDRDEAKIMMTMSSAYRVHSAWMGWTAASDRSRKVYSNVDESRQSPRDRVLGVEAFPGRWNQRRGLPPELEPLPLVVSRALEKAGWWQRGSGLACDGGLVVGCDGHLSNAIDVTRQLRKSSFITPGDFLFILPSTTTSILGLLYGFADYQATVVQGALAGIQALAHTLDLLTLNRVNRALVAVLSQAEGVRLAAALCLEPCQSRENETLIELRAGESSVIEGKDRRADEPAPSLPDAFRHLAAAPLVRLIDWVEGPHHDSREFSHTDPVLGDWLSIRAMKPRRTRKEMTVSTCAASQDRVGELVRTER